jgi:hypothetical protein
MQHKKSKKIMILVILIVSAAIGTTYLLLPKDGFMPLVACKHTKTICDSRYTDPNGGCAPIKVCIRDEAYYTCPTNAKYVSCMPPTDSQYCEEDYLTWAKRECPHFEVVY